MRFQMKGFSKNNYVTSNVTNNNKLLKVSKNIYQSPQLATPIDFKNMKKNLQGKHRGCSSCRGTF